MWKKTPLFVAVVLVSVGALSVFLYATNGVINPAFSKIEHQQVSRNIDRATSQLNYRTAQLKFKVVDWADWDDTYSFVENHNQAYIDSNLQDSALTDLGINIMLFYNENQQLVESKSVDLASGNEEPLPPALLADFKPGSKLLATSVDSQNSGLITLPDRTFQFVGLPILTTDGNGPIHGTLVFGLYLSSSEISDIESITQVNIQYWRLNDPKRPAALIAAVGVHPSKPVTAIVPISNTQITGYGTINDVFGRPALVAKITQNRGIHQVAQSALREYFLIILLDSLGAILLYGVLAYIINQKNHTIALKNEFFSIASHELRTPLTVIRDYNQLMKFKFSKAIGNPEFDHMTDNVDKTSAQLIELVGVFLDAARLERGKIPYNIEAFSLPVLVGGLLGELQVAANAKHLTLTAELPSNLPLVKADRVRVQQIITNLVGNAMKFTDGGSITLKASADRHHVTVYVTDTGRGMNKAEQRNLFLRFRQNRTKDALHGSGLGLFISKKLVEQMNGTIKLESSEPGVGTTISFTLPIAENAPIKLGQSPSIADLAHAMATSPATPAKPTAVPPPSTTQPPPPAPPPPPPAAP